MTENKRHSILLVDDDISTLKVLVKMLASDKFDITTASSAQNAISLIKEKHFSVILSDIHLGTWDGLALLPYVHDTEKPTLIIFLTGQGSMETAMKALRAGAFDYISKPLNLFDLKPDLDSLLDRAFQQLESMEKGPEKSPISVQESSRTLIGRAPQMVKIYRLIAKAALTSGNVLILGESGTGKELVARAIHDNSNRAKQSFVAVNCCALTESLLESELFGHVRGAFTGATTTKAGLFEEADGGTLFLDEIGDLSQAMQVKLLRALQEGEIKPVGSIESKRVNVRVISATHRDLDEYILDGRFREDLYYRLKVFLIELPALRERKEDIEDLVNYFLARTNKKTGKEVSGVSAEVMEFLHSYPWPGNIRELENTIECAVSMTNMSVLCPEDFLEKFRTKGQDQAKEALPVATHEAQSSTPAPSQSEPSEELIEPLEQMEDRHIRKVLESVHFNKTKAADLLGIDRATLYRKAERYGIPMADQPKP